MFVRLSRGSLWSPWLAGSLRPAVAAGATSTLLAHRSHAIPPQLSQRWQSTRVPGHTSLYLHPTPTKDRYALSFLGSAPPSEDSPTVIGIVEGAEVTPRTFSENPQWRMMMHEILANAAFEDETLKTQAANRIEGYLHIIDERNLPALNRAGEPEDIIASVLCKDGTLVAGQYEPGDAYRIVTANGPMKLPEGLTKSLLRGLAVARSIELQMQAASKDS